MSRKIYLDYAASTPVKTDVLKKIKPFITKGIGNPSSEHYHGFMLKKEIERARVICASYLKCRPDEIYFTSGASESNSIVSRLCEVGAMAFSHDSMFSYKKKQEYYNPDKKYEVISFPLVENIMGIEVSSLISSFCNDNLHLDLTQAVGKIDINLHEWSNVKFASLSAHKIGGLKGCGLLYIRKNFLDKEVLRRERLINGHQEDEVRGGTENVLGIISLGAAIEVLDMKRDNKKREKFISYIRKYCIKNEIVSYDQHVSGYHPGVINIVLRHLDAHTTVSIFNSFGISISAGSACNAKKTDKHPAIYDYFNVMYPENVIRVSVGNKTKKNEIKIFCKTLKMIIDKYDNV